MFCLFTGFFHLTFASNRLRFFSVSNTSETQSVSLDQCNQTGASLVTLYDEEDANFTAKFVDSYDWVWLGLRRKRTQITWSDGTPIPFSESSVTVTNGEQICEAIDNDTWSAFNCLEKKPFMCNDGMFKHI